MFPNSVGVLNNFDHNYQDWETYKKRLFQWFIANEITEVNDKSGVRRRAILLSALSEPTYKLANDLALPHQIENKDLEDIISILDAHFIPKRCGFAERHKFHVAVQESDEGHAAWAARLRGLAARCAFSNLEEALLDRFVVGLRPGHERDRLFAEDVSNLTLARAVQLAESIQCARAGAAVVPLGNAATKHLDPVLNVRTTGREGYASRRTGDRSGRGRGKLVAADSGGEAVGGGDSARSGNQCSVCGASSHVSASCRFRSYKCRKCNTKGHLRKMCTLKVVNLVEKETMSEEDDGKKSKLFNISCTEGRPMFVMVKINGREHRFEIDSGSAVSVISIQTYNSEFSSVPLLGSDKRLVNYTGDRIETVGRARLEVAFGARSALLDVYVARRGGPPLLGRDFIHKFGLELVPIKYCAQTHTEIVDNLVHSFPELFADKLGRFNKYKIKLFLKPDAKPVFFKARSLPFALKEKVNKELDRLLELGILKPIEYSEYASPIVPVLKNDGSIRICADYSVSLNKHLLVGKYPLPTVEELFSRLHGGKQFTKLDLSMAYNQFELDENFQEMTSINTHRGLFKYTRLVFGLSSAPAIFQRSMENLLTGIDGVLCFLDDILITGRDQSEHLCRLKEVLRRLQDAGLTLQKNKCFFFEEEVSYLGHIINKNGIRKNPNKIRAIINSSPPKNVSELQSFLGLINYYRNFIPSASSVLSPLYSLLRKNVKFTWKSEHDQAFKTIKALLTSDKVLAHFDTSPGARTILTVDASSRGLGAVLSQVGADGRERPVAFASRTLAPAETRYAQIQKEATAIIFGVRRFHQYLYARSEPFVLRTDHKPLIAIFGPHRGIPVVSANRLQRYAIFLSAYNYSIEYVRSGENSADFLSRCTETEGRAAAGGATGGAAANSDTTAGAGAGVGRESAAYVNFVLEGDLPVTLETLKMEIRNDSVLQKVIKYIAKGWPKKVKDPQLQQFHFRRVELSYDNELLMRGHRLVIPSKLRERFLTELHSSHFGIMKMKAAARGRFWFPGIDAALERVAAGCAVCAALRPAPPRAPLAPWPYPPHAFYRIHLDFLGPFYNKIYLIVVDAYSKWVECFSMSSRATSAAVIDKLHEFMSRVGVPHTLVSDNGAAFTSNEFKKFCELNGIIHIFSPVYCPASNGQAESAVKIVKAGMKLILHEHGTSTDLNKRLLKFLFDYRNAKHSTTGRSPAELVYGRQLRCRLDLIGQGRLEGASESFASSSLTSLANDVRRHQCSQSRFYRGRARAAFEPNDQVLVKNYLNKNKFTWVRGTIKAKLGRVLYSVFVPALNLTMRRHINQIRKYNGQCLPNPVNEAYEWSGPGIWQESEYASTNEDSHTPNTSDKTPHPSPHDSGALAGEEKQLRPESGSALTPEVATSSSGATSEVLSDERLEERRRGRTQSGSEVLGAPTSDPRTDYDPAESSVVNPPRRPTITFRPRKPIDYREHK